MTPLKITAHTPVGFASADPWSPSLDGILAYQIVREHLGDEFALISSDDAKMSPVEGLPLVVERYGDWWWYACSAPLYQSVQQVRRYYHRRFDATAAETWLDEKKSRVLVGAGPYKNARLHHLVTICPVVTWHVIGDRSEIKRLLLPVRNIGRGTASGMGRVTRWEIEEGDPEIAQRFRPLPVDYAKEMGICGPLMEWGIRPPARLPTNRTLCVMPSRK